MTIEDAKHIVDVAFGVPQAVRRAGEDRTYHEDEIREAKNMAIKALEQEPILDKIRAEIERLHYHPKLDFIKNDEVVEMALDIIDKYKAESDGEK